MLPNVPYFPIAYYGALRAGAVVVPLNPLLKAREVAFHLGDSGAKVPLAWHQSANAAHAGAEQAGADCVLIEPGALEALAARCEPVTQSVPRAASDTAVILYTSGTTGTPKGAELTHANLIRNMEVMRALFGISDRDVTLGALPFFHAFGQTCALNTTLAAGGAAMPVEIMQAFERRFGCPVLEGYGPLGDVAGGLLQPPRPRAQARLDRAPSTASSCDCSTTARSPSAATT